MRISLGKKVKALLSKLQTLLRKIKEDPNNWRDVCSWIGRHNIVNIAILSKFIYRVNAIPIKHPRRLFFLFCINEQADCKIYMEMPKQF